MFNLREECGFGCNQMPINSCGQRSGCNGGQNQGCGCNRKPDCGCDRKPDCGCNQEEFRPEPFVGDIHCAALQNNAFRRVYWTGKYMQITLMCIPCNEDIGLEMHRDTDQMIRIEQGQAIVKMGNCRENLGKCMTLKQGDVVCIPAGVWHNIINTGSCALKLSTVYAPPHHRRDLVQKTK